MIRSAILPVGEELVVYVLYTTDGSDLRYGLTRQRRVGNPPIQDDLADCQPKPYLIPTAIMRSLRTIRYR